MKQSDLKRIIKEEVNRELMMEGIIDSLIMLFLSPKLKRDTDKLKNSPDWKELVQKINSTREEMDMYNKRLAKYLVDYNKIAADAKKKGLKVKTNSTIEDLIAMTSKY
jgi:cell division protein FtsL